MISGPENGRPAFPPSMGQPTLALFIFVLYQLSDVSKDQLRDYSFKIYQKEPSVILSFIDFRGRNTCIGNGNLISLIAFGRLAILLKCINT